MTAPVDVLAVMDRDAADADAYRLHLTVEPIDKADIPSTRRSESDEARAAVAELLEADTEYELLCSVFPCPEDRVAELIGDLAEYAAKMKAADQRRHVALLRCKGGAA